MDKLLGQQIDISWIMNRQILIFIHCITKNRNRKTGWVTWNSLRESRYRVGSGNIVGLPDQTLDDIADDIILCRALDVDMASFGPFVPAPNTPYQNENEGNLILTLKTLALVRLYLNKVHVHATNELDIIDKEGREKGISAGANVIMPNFTPFPYRENFKRYSPAYQNSRWSAFISFYD